MDCVIIGAGGHGRVVLDIMQHEGRHEVVGFLDSNPDLHGRLMDGVEVLGPIQRLAGLKEQGVLGAIVAVGHNGTRRSFGEQVQRLGHELVSAIHPSANIASNVSLGRGVVVAAGALVCAHCQIGDGVILNTGCLVDHETMIGTACHLCPGVKIAGRVTIESGAFVGIGATVIQHVRVGHDSVIGAGAVVLKDVPPMSTVVGLPAREIKSLSNPNEFAEWLMPETLESTQ
ncbi:MAG: acetyltransferase [Planctomycetes bacterium]|nr:acetyltransferase [Planctomycetota bacterium]